MNLTRYNIKTFPGRLFVFLAAAVCALALSPLIVQADDIDDMLASGSYVECEVIAAIMADSSMMQAESDVPYEVTELISVDSSAVQQSARDGETKKSGYSVKVTTSISDNRMYCNVYDEASVELGHGTHTAGIIGAEWNGFGTSGVASNVRIVCIQLSDEQGNESLADALVAYAFVNRFNELVPEEEHIRVTSNSWSRYSSSRALDAVLRDLDLRL